MGVWKMGLQDKVHALYDVISEKYYRNVPDLRVTDGKNRKAYNSCLLFSTLTALNNGKILLFGEYGGGKTTSAEYVLSLFRGIPLDVVQMGQIRGHPELTEEKIKGRPDLAKMNAGIGEEVIWEFFPLLPGHVIDEINRIPESKQSMILEGVGRGIWQYLREIIFKEHTPLFSTNNYADKGNVELVPPMKDRFDISVESKYPGVLNAMEIMLDYTNDDNALLKNEDISGRVIDALLEGKDAAREKLPALLEEYKRHVEESLGVQTLSAEELSQIEDEIRRMPLDEGAMTLMKMLITEMNWNPETGQKRTGEMPQGNHYEMYLFSRIENAGSRRMDKSIVHYARSLAWITGSERVTAEHISTIAPYAMWHRVQWADTEWYRGLKSATERDDPLDLYACKEAVKSVKGRMMDAMRDRDGSLPEFFEMQKEVVEGSVEFRAFQKKFKDHPHPLYKEVLKITERLTQW